MTDSKGLPTTGTTTPPPTTGAAGRAQDQTGSPADAAEQSAHAAPEKEPLPEPQSEILPATHWAQLSLDTEAPQDDAGDPDDGDSAFGDAASSTASLSESILEYRNIHGRTFHSNVGVAESWIPNDEQQQESMDIHHHMCTLALGDKLFLAPLKPDIKKVVDIGTGTDFAEQFPGAEVTGTDLSPIQPGWVPPNVRFEIDDANLRWTWHDNTFDYVHLRGLMGSIVDWHALYRDAFRVCKPGGYVEHFENSINMDCDDGSIAPGSPMHQWGKVFWAGGEKFGRTFRVVEDDIQKKCMEEAGFVDITVWEHKCPIGSWPADPRLKTLGQFSRLVLESDAEGYVLYMWNAVMGWSPTEIQVYLAHLRRQVRDDNVHALYRQRVVYGRKP
ncbi:methyltransferase type 11 [Coniochaeta ligniaria NRRL 30616]|uniref:Methyltransferase type 11 n=1 Tax=Coniochaeta ligniaria NRRL 30616 TaxID=1408157 RepID=A0A1J7JHE9_9PEZI|nr:methyltransferase type 11 [Coniochaeta ligniaria NRRL 30616]